jgi:2-isopropylmalate synthase
MGGSWPSAHDADPHIGDVGLTTAEAREAGRVILAEYGIEPPPDLLTEFAARSAAAWRADSDKSAAERLWETFEREYLLREPVSALLIRCTAPRADISQSDPWIALFNIRQSIGTARENPALVVSGFLTSMGVDVSVLRRHAQVLGTNGLTIAYVKCLAGLPAWGVGMGGDLASASLKAVLSAVNRARLLSTAQRELEATEESG